MERITKVKTSNSDHFRFTIAWILIIAITLSLLIAILYNISAIMMLFGEGDLHFQNYSDLKQTVESQPYNYAITGEKKENGYTKYNFHAKSNVSSTSIVAQENRIVSITIRFNIDEFMSQNMLDKYAAIDQVLRPIYKGSDVMAAEIAIIKISSQLAINRNLFQISSNYKVDTKNFSLTMHTNPPNVVLNLTPKNA